MAQTLELPREYARPCIEEWFRDSQPRSAVLVATQSRLPGAAAAVVHQNQKPGTSMMHSGHESLAGLTRGDTVLSSIRTPTITGHHGKARQFILEADSEGALQVAPIRNPPEYQCHLWFLGCRKVFTEEMDWRRHLQQHFAAAGPPSRGTCCFCGNPYAWHELLVHLKTRHFVLGHRVAHSRPDFELINYLRDKRIISDQDWKDLQGTAIGRPATEQLSDMASRHSQGAQSANTQKPYMVMHDPRRERRRARN